MAKAPIPEPQNSNPLPSIAANTTGGAKCFDVAYLQTLDNDTASSILEFLVRQRSIPEYVVNAVFLALPLVNPISSRLKKAILFRRLASELVLRSFSEKTLTIFELIEEVDRENGGFPPCESMKAAYCAVASSCTAAALRQNVNEFLDSFYRIWVLRMCDIEKSAAASLISEELREVRDIFWEVVKDPGLQPLVVSTDLEETLDRVRDYLEEVWDMEPLFPEVAEDEIEEIRADLRVPGERRDAREGLSGLKNQRLGFAEPAELERLLMKAGMEAQNEIVEPIDSDYEYVGPLDQDKGLEITYAIVITSAVEKGRDLMSSDLHVQRMVQGTLLDPGNKASESLAENSEQECNMKFKRSNGQNRRDKLISDSEIGSEVAGTKGKQTAVDDEQALKASYLDLQSMVRNTLLDASNKAIELQAVNPEEAYSGELRVNDVQNRRDEIASTSKIGTKNTSIEENEAIATLNQHQKPSCLKEKEEIQNGQDGSAKMASLEKVPDIPPDGKNYTQNNSSSASLPRGSLMERNPTAHTLEWTDSPRPEGRIHLHSPTREPVSPLNLIGDKRYAKRRKVRKWTLLEEETLLKAVREHGKGCWKAILTIYPNIFEERTEVDLKDKWRNMTRSNWPS
ncbi:hypothetical protein IEQ34_012116 [Dendrobium chrysotoxum]|uniref:Uncharacterized protein n=1 Tax=Dendrobium chrysotoxum TaxID=161865 RepID=A0AAV7GUR6_DENCH|nr:hypothetical protein IEQ34_012116 [Dendrobium chrysotoxum]